jgi:hypothetical protein
LWAATFSSHAATGSAETGNVTVDTRSDNADLSALTLSTDSLSPTFANSTTTYTASVSNATTSLTVTPTRAEANAAIEVRVNGGSYTSVTSGSPSGSLSLNVGSNSIDICVTAQAGNTKTYTVTVTRLAPPTVTSPTRTSITATGATLGGNVTDDGGATITERGVVYSVTATNNNPLIGGGGVTKVPAAGTTGAFTAPVTGLASGTVYSYKAYATNIEGTSYTSLATFFTDTTVAFIGGIGTVTDRPIPAGDRQVFRFTLAEARMVNFTGTGAAGFDWELRDGSNAVVASGNGDVALARLLLGGNYSLVLTNATATDATVSLNLDASVVAVSRPDLQVGPSSLAPVGANQYSPVVQTTILTSRTARPVTGYARVGNDGNLPTVLRVFGRRGTTLFPVTYFGPLGTNPNANLTGEITAGTYATPNLEKTSAPVTIRLVIAPNKASIVSRRRVGTQSVTTTRRLTFNAVIRATSVSGPAASDSATIRVNTR